MLCGVSVRLQSDGARAAAAVAGRDEAAAEDADDPDDADASSAPISERPRCITPAAGGTVPTVPEFEFADTV